MSPFAGYLLGILVLVAGLAVAAFLLNVPTGAVVAAVVLALFALAAWATRRPRAKPSKFTGGTPSAPSLDRTVLMELKTTLMEQADKTRTQPTTRIPPANEARVQPTTRIDKQTAPPRRPPKPRLPDN